LQASTECLKPSYNIHHSISCDLSIARLVRQKVHSVVVMAHDMTDQPSWLCWL